MSCFPHYGGLNAYAEWFLTTMPVCMITFGRDERFFRAGARLVQR
jgi:hypothetical protein